MQLIDRLTLADVSPVQIIDSFEGGVWMVWQYRYDASSCADTVHCTARDSCESSTRVNHRVSRVCVIIMFACRGGVRMRVNYIRGTNQVISAVLFDVAPLQ